MWMWEDKERFNKLIKSVQKWLEFQSSGDTKIDEEVAEQAYTKTRAYSYGIIEKLDIPDDGTAGFLQSWAELCMFSGYLVGWKDSDKLIGDDPAQAGGQGQQSGDFFISAHIDKQAKNYAKEATDEVFLRLASEPVSPLILGLDSKFVELLKIVHEASLYAGFMSGAEDAFLVKVKRFDPFGLKRDPN